MRQHFDGSHIAGPERQISCRVVRGTREPVQVKVRIDVRLFQNFKNILLDIGRKFRAVEQFLAGPQCPGEHASSTLCIRTVRRVGEIERTDCAKNREHLGVETRFLCTPDKARCSYDIRTGEYRVRIHREILEKIRKCTTEPTLTALILDEKHHLIGSFLGLLFFPALQHGLGSTDGIHHIPAGLENIHGQSLLQSTQNLILRFGRDIWTGRGKNHPWKLRGSAGECVVQVGIGDAGLERSKIDRGINTESFHALTVRTRKHAVLLLPTFLQDLTQRLAVYHLTILLGDSSIESTHDFIGKRVNRFLRNVLDFIHPLDCAVTHQTILLRIRRLPASFSATSFRFSEGSFLWCISKAAYCKASCM